MRTYRKDAKTKYFELIKQGWTQGKAAAYVGVPKQTASDWQAGTGESLPNLNIKLTAEHKADIVKRADRGETQAAIAADYGVSTKTISNVARKAQAKKAAKAQAKKSAEAASGVATIYHETCAAFLKRFEKQSVDLLLTDPPYMTDVDDDDNDIDKFAKSWLSEALSKLKSTGRAFWEAKLKRTRRTFGTRRVQASALGRHGARVDSTRDNQ